MSRRIVDTVIFDCDGVIVDSAPFYEQVEQRQAAELAADNGLAFTLADYDWSVMQGWDRRRIAAKLFSVEPESDLAGTYRARVVHDIISGISPEATPLYDGVDEFMGYLLLRGCRIGVASSSSRAVLNRYLEMLPLQHLSPAYTVASQEAGANKPSPAPYLEVMKRLDATPEQTLVIDDSTPGIDSGRYAGALVMSPANTYSSEYLAAHTAAQLIIGSYGEAASLLQPYLP
jgi:HAD superfamily hydrolase (TIGR01509 family)